MVASTPGCCCHSATGQVHEKFVSSSRPLIQTAINHVGTPMPIHVGFPPRWGKCELAPDGPYAEFCSRIVVDLSTVLRFLLFLFGRPPIFYPSFPMLQPERLVSSSRFRC